MPDDPEEDKPEGDRKIEDMPLDELDLAGKKIRVGPKGNIMIHKKEVEKGKNPGFLPKISLLRRNKGQQPPAQVPPQPQLARPVQPTKYRLRPAFPAVRQPQPPPQTTLPQQPAVTGQVQIPKRSGGSYGFFKTTINRISSKLVSIRASRQAPSYKNQMDRVSALQAKYTKLELKQLKEHMREEQWGKIGRLLGALFFIGLILFVFYSFETHSFLFSYNEQAFYGPFFSTLFSLSSGLVNSLSSNLACVANPVACSNLYTTPQVVNSPNTFQSFISASETPAETQLIMSLNPQQEELFYSVQNTGSVPLGLSTSNPLYMNISCGNSNDQAAGIICNSTLTSFSQPAGSKYADNVPFIGEIFPGQTIENETAFYLQCPSSSSTVILPAVASIEANFTIKNYSSATLMPLELASKTFIDQLIQSSQSFSPQAPSISFVSSGPVSIVVSTPEPQPVLTESGQIPISVQIQNNGQGKYLINKLELFISKDLWPVNPASSNTGWSCSSSASVRQLDFVLPNESFWDCVYSQPITPSLSGFIFKLPQVSSLNGLHFDTLPVIGLANYNYFQSLDMPFIIRNESVC
ncbi:hypothetical protein M1293_03635 [Candidatus Parvarchaeota archaeon]|nr:hypothetical protein [Candidatus Parvarchaeota archaeon]